MQLFVEHYKFLAEDFEKDWNNWRVLACLKMEAPVL